MSVVQFSIQADRRERGRILKGLEEAEGVHLEMVDLEFGDYVLPNKIVVERKSATDFILSVVDEGLWTNIDNLERLYTRIVYIVEGDPYVARFHQKALDVHRAFARMVVRHGISVLPSADADHSAMLIYLMGLSALEQTTEA